MYELCDDDDEEEVVNLLALHSVAVVLISDPPYSSTMFCSFKTGITVVLYKKFKNFNTSLSN